MKLLIKRGFFVFFIVLLLLELISASDVAYILRNDRIANQEILESFSDLGLSVDLIEDQDVVKTNLNQYKLIFIGDERLRNGKNIDIYKYPSVIMNLYYGPEFGLTDIDGISQLASTEPMSVRVSEGPLKGIKQVYNQALFDTSRIAIPYYYLEDENKVNTKSIARTYIGNSYNFGDVIGVIPTGTRLKNGKLSQDKICFYGISKTQYWTKNSEDLFKQCIAEVLTTCNSDTDCEDNNEYTKDTCVNPGQVNSECKHEEIKCIFDSDCGEITVSPRYCSLNNVFIKHKEPKCLNPGEVNSECIVNERVELIEECEDGCTNGFCTNIKCEKNEDCDDNDQYTKDTCVNPGTEQSYCKHDNITCFNKFDCGTDGLSEFYCSGKDVYQDSLNYECLNPGQVNSECIEDKNSFLIKECDFSCIDGECSNIRCEKNEDCDDNNERTFDECVNKGTQASFCRNTEVNCLNNEDCGFMGFLGNEFCNSNKIFKQKQEVSCLNPGKLISYCIIKQSPIMLGDCGEDSCELQGDEYCEGNNVYQNKVCSKRSCAEEQNIAMCKEVLEEESVLIQECDYLCSNGECIDEPVEKIHDLGFVDFEGSVNKIKLKDIETGEVILGESINKLVKLKLKLKIKGILMKHLK